MDVKAFFISFSLLPKPFFTRLLNYRSEANQLTLEILTLKFGSLNAMAEQTNNGKVHFLI